MSGLEWGIRAKKYDNLDWTNRDEYIEKLLKMCNLKSDDIALDVGTGTGIIAEALGYYCMNVDAIDLSESMIDIAKSKRQLTNIHYSIMDAEHMDIESKTYDCVTARMCFHHIGDQNAAIRECIRVLKKKGVFVISEGIPPQGCRRFYTDMFTFKEERRTYTLDDLVELLKYGGFSDLKINIHRMQNVSINNWLENSGLSEKKCKKIFNIHLDCEEYVKEAYNMKMLDGDIYMDWLSAIVSGIK